MYSADPYALNDFQRVKVVTSGGTPDRMSVRDSQVLHVGYRFAALAWLIIPCAAFVEPFTYSPVWRAPPSRDAGRSIVAFRPGGFLKRAKQVQTSENETKERNVSGKGEWAVKTKLALYRWKRIARVNG